MVSSVSKIGVQKIILPDLPQLQFMDGVTLAQAHIDDALVRGITEGNAKIAILVPEYFEMYPATLPKGAKVMSDFFAGLLEPTLETIRDVHFPQLRPQARRDKLFVVGAVEDKPGDFLKKTFHTAWVTYDPLEKFISDKINIGILHEDGTHSMARFFEPRHFDDTCYDKKISDKIFAFGYKYFKALDGMFAANLRLRDYFDAEGQYIPSGRNRPQPS